MKPEAGIWNKLTRIVIFLILIAGLIALGLWYLPLIQLNERMRREIHQLESELKTERETSRQLQAEIKLLTKDPEALERQIRARLGLAHPGETVIRFEADTTNSARRLP